MAPLSRSDIFLDHLPAGLVALEPAGAFARLFCRHQQGVTFQDIPFRPYFFVRSSSQLHKLTVPFQAERLSGEGELCLLVSTETWQQWCRLREQLQQQVAPSDWYAVPDYRQQFLIATGLRLFQGMDDEGPVVLALRITVDQTSNALTSVMLACGKKQDCWHAGAQHDEASLLRQLTVALRELDPDVVIGHELYRHDLPIIQQRATRYGLTLSWGRNSAPLHRVEQGSRFSYEAYGRCLVDLARLLHQQGRLTTPLTAAALRQTLQQPDVVPPAGDSGCFAAAEAGQLLHLYQLLMPDRYQLTRRYPLTLSNILQHTGVNGITAGLLQHAVHCRTALPAPSSGIQQDGSAANRPYRQGRFSPVLHLDLANLPTAIVQTYQLGPAQPWRHLFLQLLAEACSTAAAAESRALQRLLLDQFRELLVRSGPFTDQQAAAELRRLTSVMHRDLGRWLQEAGATPVIHDNNGIYWTPGADDADTVLLKLAKRLQELLPGYTALSIDSSYPAMLCYRPNSYAVLNESGRVLFHGTPAFSRSMEPYLKEFLTEAITVLLLGNETELGGCYEQYRKRLLDRHCPVSWVSRCELLRTAPDAYRQAVASGQHRYAVGELALRYPDRFQAGDRICYYITGTARQVRLHEQCRLVSDFDPQHPDLNRAWYLDRLSLLYQRLTSRLTGSPGLFA